MHWLNLKRLWLACAGMTLVLLLLWLFSCGQAMRPFLPGMATTPPAKAPEPEKTRPWPAQSYTYVGQVRPVRRPAKPGRAPAAEDTTLRIQRRESVASKTGEIPDLSIDLAGHAITEVMARYGYVPAVTSRHRLLGKIVDQKFEPLTASELSKYARRGRSGRDFPEAGRWLERVAREFDLPREELRLIFLVPHASEQRFLAAETAALARAGQSASNIAMVRAHFDTGLAIVVDELVTKAGETIPVDSVRRP